MNTQVKMPRPAATEQGQKNTTSHLYNISRHDICQEKNAECNDTICRFTIDVLHTGIFYNE